MERDNRFGRKESFRLRLLTIFPVCQASPTFPEVCFHPGWDSLFPQTSIWPFSLPLGFFLAHDRNQALSQSSASSYKFVFRRSFVFAFIIPSAGSTLKGLRVS